MSIENELEEILKMQRINLGNKVKDRYTGFEGIALERVEHLYYGTKIGVLLARLSEDGFPFDMCYFAENQLEEIK